MYSGRKYFSKLEVKDLKVKELAVEDLKVTYEIEFPESVGLDSVETKRMVVTVEGSLPAGFSIVGSPVKFTNWGELITYLDTHLHDSEDITPNKVSSNELAVVTTASLPAGTTFGVTFTNFDSSFDSAFQYLDTYTSETETTKETRDRIYQTTINQEGVNVHHNIFTGNPTTRYQGLSGGHYIYYHASRSNDIVNPVQRAMVNYIGVSASSSYKQQTNYGIGRDYNSTNMNAMLYSIGWNEDGHERKSTLIGGGPDNLLSTSDYNPPSNYIKKIFPLLFLVTQDPELVSESETKYLNSNIILFSGQHFSAICQGCALVNEGGTTVLTALYNPGVATRPNNISCIQQSNDNIFLKAYKRSTGDFLTIAWTETTTNTLKVTNLLSYGDIELHDDSESRLEWFNPTQDDEPGYDDIRWNSALSRVYVDTSTVSSRRFKTDIRLLEKDEWKALEKLKRIKFSVFRRINRGKKEDFLTDPVTKKTILDKDGKKIKDKYFVPKINPIEKGVIAEELAEVDESLIIKDAEGEAIKLNQLNCITFLMKAVQELTQRVETLTNQITLLNNGKREEI